MSTQSISSSSSDQQQRTSTVVDLRSDTVTRPTPAMRRAMADAEVGDDVYGEDPTVNRLEQRAAEIFGRDAAIFVPTGTMGNQIAIKLHTQPGGEVICEQRAHIYEWEMGMLASYSGLLPRLVYAKDGMLTWPDIQKAITPKIYYKTQTSLISLENTHNVAGGTVMPTEVVNDICDRAHEAGIPVHMDGARIFNAAVALGKPVAEITKKLDSLMFCLSKGLGAPVGSLLVGNKDFIAKARSVRKALGGGMRQAGILAAAGLIALEEGPKRLHEDHANAKFMASKIAAIPGVNMDVGKVVTNMVMFQVEQVTPAELSKRLAARGVLINPITADTMRIVTHMDVDRSACERACEELASVLKSA